MVWASNYECKNCGHSFAWPWRKTDPRYLMPDGLIFRMKTEIGWCEPCQRPSEFECLEDDGTRLQALIDLQHETRQQLLRWGALRRWLFQKKYAHLLALLNAYRKLQLEEEARIRFLSSRQERHCLYCSGITMADAFDSSKWLKCRKCGCTMEHDDPGVKFIRIKKPHFYDQNCQPIEIADWEVMELVAQDAVMKEAEMAVFQKNLPDFLRQQAN